MEGAAQKTPMDEDPRDGVIRRRNIRKKGGVAERVSRRVKGEQPSVLDGPANIIAVKKLSLGGQGGRIYKDKTEWNFENVRRTEETKKPTIHKWKEADLTG